MKLNIFKYITPIIVLSATLLSSCEELELDTKGTVPEENYFTIENALEPAVVGIYARVHRGTWALDQCAPYYGADDLTSRTGSNKQPVLEADQFARTDGNSWVANTYNLYYDAINACNSLISGVERDGENLDPAQATNAIANARFIRGMLYFRLATSFKNIPMPLTSELDLTISRTPYQEVMNQVISDLKYAEKFLNSARDGNPEAIDGHATIVAAKAFLAKTYMQLTGYPTDLTSIIVGDETIILWDEVQRLTKEIIDEGKYSLTDDFAACFQEPTQINKEMIFSHMCTRGAGAVKAESRYYGFKWRDWGDCYLEHKFSDAYPDGYRRHFSIVTIADTITKTDKTTKEYKPFIKTWKHPMVSKFSYGTIKGNPGFEHKWQTSNDCPAMRTAEVYLMYAEACARKSEFTEAKRYLNYIKRRASARGTTTQAEAQALPMGFWMDDSYTMDDYSGADVVDELVDAIVMERAYEFLGETGGNRWLDLLRLRRIAEVNEYRKTADNEEEMIGDPADETQWWTPLPGTELILNPNLVE
ncbi:RagB/SusD family nutrient uptake outer membrane protein [Labilibacter marinus]|uniref:RagB/SusD family nutrient uptake outer membrane protein n=1 Tax=Labilibacter marinus TaxID=1477105 RepID=UPI0008326140|nr:RagB/SusD family nutrient uptake outer membrane protein [Labilibacter marinus]